MISQFCSGESQLQIWLLDISGVLPLPYCSTEERNIEVFLYFWVKYWTYRSSFHASWSTFFLVTRVLYEQHDYIIYCILYLITLKVSGA